MSPPNAPFIPGTRLPSVREVDATGGAPHTKPPPRQPQPSHEHIELKGRGWSASVPAVVISSALTAIVMRLTAPAAVPPEDTLRRDMRDLTTDMRAQQQNDRETRAQQAQQEQALNAVRADVAGLRAEVRELTRAIEEQRKR